MSTSEHNQSKRPGEPASPAQSGPAENRVRLRADASRLVPDITAADDTSTTATPKPQRTIHSLFAEEGDEPVVTTKPRMISPADHERAQRAKLAELLNSSVTFPDSQSVLVRVTTRDEADVILGQVPADARRGFVQEVPGPYENSQNHMIGIFSIDPTERETWKPVETPQQNRNDQQEEHQMLFTHDSGPLTREELAFAQQIVEQKSEEKIAFIKAGTRFGRLDHDTLNKIETERHRSRKEVGILAAAASTIAPLPPGIHTIEPEVKLITGNEDQIEENPVPTYDHAREQLRRQLATADSSTFEAIREWTQHKNDSLRVEAALRHHMGTGIPLTEVQVRDARAFRDTDNDMQTKCDGPDGTRYRKAQKIFQQALSVYENATPAPLATTENPIDSSTERQRLALAAFLEDFDQMDQVRIVDVYHNARVELIKNLGSNTSGTPLFEAVMARLEHRKAQKDAKFFELKKGKANDPYLDDQIRLAKRRVSDANKSLLEITIHNARLGLDTAMAAFGNYMKLASSDATIPPNDGTQITRTRREIMILERIMADMKTLPVPEKKESGESDDVVLYEKPAHTVASATNSEHNGRAKEFGKNRKEDFKIIAQLAEDYARNNPGLVENYQTLYQPFMPGLFDTRGDMRIRDLLQLNLGSVTVLHDGQTTRQYKVMIGLVSVYNGIYNNRSGSFIWMNEHGKRVELPPYIHHRGSVQFASWYSYRDSEITKLRELPESFNLSHITLVPIDSATGEPSEIENYDISTTKNGDRTKYRIFGKRGQGQRANALPMHKAAYRKRLKEIMDQLPKAS